MNEQEVKLWYEGLRTLFPRMNFTPWDRLTKKGNADAHAVFEKREPEIRKAQKTFKRNRGE